MRLVLLSVAVIVLLSIGSATAIAQDIELAAARSGLALPNAYFERIAAQPDFFTLQSAWVRKARSAAQQRAAVDGELKIIVVQALHADTPDPTFTAEDLERVYFTGPYANGTLAEFYDEVSSGRLSVTGDVTDWVRTSLTRSEVVGASYGLGEDARTGEYLVESLGLVDSGIDFGLYDNDGPDGLPNSGDDDGEVDVVAFQFHDISASCGGPGIWPHRASILGWTGAPFVTDDARSGGGSITISGYTIQSVVNCGGTVITTAGTMAHELGHALGLRDYRHHVGGVEPQYRRWLIGCWGLMSGGSWGCSDVSGSVWVRPIHMTPIAKMEMGWLGSVQDVGEEELLEITLQPVVTHQHVLRVPLRGSEEYLLVEFRDKIGFDLALPSAGVLVYHMEPERGFPCADCPRLYPFYLAEADGRGDLLRTSLEGGNIGEASDPFGAAGPVSFTNFTHPSTRLNGGGESQVNFYRIAVENGVAVLTLSTAPISANRAIAPFLLTGVDPLADVEQDFLDLSANQNGRYDVGDLRAHLQR